MADKSHYRVLIVGGGTAGSTVAASLRRHGGPGVDIGIVEPSPVHYYQPAFTLVGGGVCGLQSTRRDQSRLIPPGVTWIRDAASGFEPQANRVSLASGGVLSYDYLVACPGLQLNWEQVPGLKEALGSNGVCSNYSPAYVEYTWECVRGLEAGQRAVFTQAPLPFKCPGAPQKIAYLTADHLRRRGLLERCSLHFCTHAPSMFGVPLFAAELAKIADGYGIDKRFQHNLVAVDGAARAATFEIAGGDRQGERVTLAFDMLHATPPQSAPDVVRASPLANAAGWIEVHQHSLQHVRYPNVFGCGDATSTPNSKTAAAVRKQAPVVVRNLLHSMRGGSLEEGYDGYASCPLTTAYGKVLMAEFCYGGKVTPTFPLDPRKERGTYWWCKTTGLPIMYWHYMLRGYEWFPGHDTGWQARHGL
ncbi:MAG: NAD(P)/FAD-dependent oxidoreductase [Gammaproteobacteria bacterium]|nr:NAD(P)/FAD-dependent oxidoreductase [Gammaproteobacteria bacterium]